MIAFKTSIMAFLALFAAAMFPAFTFAAPIPVDKAVEAASVFTGHLMSGDFAKADAMSDKAVVDSFAKSGLSGWGQLWGMLKAQLGEPKSMEAPYVSQNRGDLAITLIPTAFPASTLDLQVTVLPPGTIGGLQVLPHADRNARAPVYADPATFTEVDVPIGPKDKPVMGKLAIPKDKQSFTAVVMLSGSGPNDMDETINSNKPFRDIAQGLAAKGIATLRYDKRTKVYGLAGAKAGGALRLEYMDDAKAAIAMLTQIPGVAKVVVLGHSEGAALAPMVAAESPIVAGVICLAGPVTPLPELMAYQYDYLIKAGTSTRELADAFSAAVKDYRAGATPPIGVISTSMLEYMRELDAMGNPAKVAAGLGKPLFLAFGSRDYQVPPTELPLWMAHLSGKDGIRTKVYEGLNHLLMKGEGMPNPFEYQVQGFVSEELVNDLAGWVYSL